ncbi:MAG: hypothetical protein IPK14_15995 [Blastocatellia bacterium]|nr:hypothetical protein [Blastocatellia bacterium]
MAVNNISNNNINRIDTNNNATENKAAEKQGSLAGLKVQKEEANGTKPLSVAKAQQKQAEEVYNQRCAPMKRGTGALKNNNTSTSAKPTPTPITDPANTLKQQINSSQITRGNNNQVNNLLNRNFNLSNDSVANGATTTTRNAAGQTTSSRVAFENGKGAVTLFDNNGSFPPSSTATLPRSVFDKEGILSFYRNSNTLTNDQKQFIQNIYKQDLTSRANYQANVNNLAKNLTDISNDPGKLSETSRREVNDALSSLRSAYDTLSDPNAAAPDPRELYRNVAEAYRALKNDPAASQDKVNDGLNILSIGASNYELNRLPVGNNPQLPAAPTADANAAGAARLAAAKGQFDVNRNKPLSDAQAKPEQVFGNQVNDFLKSIGAGNVDPKKISFQVNSADQLQAIQASLPDGRQLTALFAGGIINAANAKVAFSGIAATNNTTNNTNVKPAPITPTAPTAPTAPATPNAADAIRALKQQIATSKTAKGDDNQVNNVLRNNLNLPADAFNGASTRTTRTAGGQTANSTVTFDGNRGSVTLFNNNGSFPPSSTATLPRTVFDGRGILSFYKEANSLTDAQKKFVQNIYAQDLTSRANFQANVGNLAKNLTDIANDDRNLSADTRREVKDALNSLRKAYDTLSDPKAPSPDPRELYGNVAEAYRALKNDEAAPQGKVNTGLRILSIGTSNYELNRLPVGNNPQLPPAPAAEANAAGAARLAAAKGQFDANRNKPVSDAQAKPEQVFGNQVDDFLKSLGIKADASKIAFQVNSADQLQAIQTRLADGRRLTVLFNGGMINAANAKVAFR